MVIVLKKKDLNRLYREIAILAVLFVLILIILRIIFFNENWAGVSRVTLALFWMFIIPGYILMDFWSDKLDLIERVFAGIALSLAIEGILSYYMGLIGINLAYSSVILPVAIIIAGIFINYKKYLR